MSSRDPYQLLGVKRSASQDEIKDAYRNLAKKFHPDLNPGSKEAENRFKDISYAYERIGNPEERAKYDRGETEEAPAQEGAQAGFGGGRRSWRGPFYRQTQESEAGPGRYTFSFGEGMGEDVFESILGGMRGRGKSRYESQKGEDHLYKMDVELRDTVLGTEKEITLPSGVRLAVKIPPGISEGTRLRFAGQGGPGTHGGAHGDAYVELHVREDSRFRRDGDNLILELPISISEAVLGGEVRTPTIDGFVMLKIPPHSNTDRKLKLSNKGLYSRQKKHRGDQIVVLKIVLPSQMDPELENILRAWQGRHPYNPREHWGSV